MDRERERSSARRRERSAVTTSRGSRNHVMRGRYLLIEMFPTVIRLRRNALLLAPTDIITGMIYHFRCTTGTGHLCQAHRFRHQAGKANSFHN